MLIKRSFSFKRMFSVFPTVYLLHGMHFNVINQLVPRPLERPDWGLISSFHYMNVTNEPHNCHNNSRDWVRYKKASVTVTMCPNACWISPVRIPKAPLPSQRHVEVISAQTCSSLKRWQQHVRTWSGYTDKLAHFPQHARAHLNTHSFMHEHQNTCWLRQSFTSTLFNTLKKMTNDHFSCLTWSLWPRTAEMCDRMWRNALRIMPFVYACVRRCLSLCVWHGVMQSKAQKTWCKTD